MAYTYDSDSQVTGLSYAMGETQLGNLTYTYDADGRVTAKAGSLAAVTLPAAVSGNTFNAANELTAFNGATLTYDANGNLTGDGTNTYTWDARNHLSAIGGGATTASFVYDAFGRRMSKSINETTTQFLYDGLNPVQELDGASPPDVTANLLTGLGIDKYFTRADSSGAMSFLTDALGSTLALTDSSGSINTSYTYEPFGNTTISGSNANPYQFTGRENDGTGLYFYRARYHSPTFQRFVSPDPISFAGGGTNLYAYTGNNPLAWVDSLGLQIGPPPVPIPGAGPGNGWTWNPNPQNSRGGTWGPKAPLPGQSQPSASWDPDGHWDVDDGMGNRQRYDENGNPISPEQAHGGVTCEGGENNGEGGENGGNNSLSKALPMMMLPPILWWLLPFVTVP